MYCTIIADAREKDGAIPHLEAAVAANNRKFSKLSASQGGNAIDYITATITIGDYAVLLRNGPKSPKSLVLIVERKTWKDLAASIKDKRAKVQHDRMTTLQATTSCKCMYLIEGLWNHKDDNQVEGIAFSSLHSKIRHNTIRGIPFIQARDQVHTAKVIVDLSRDILRMASMGELLIPGLNGTETTIMQAYELELLNLQTRYKVLAGKDVYDKTQKTASTIKTKAPELMGMTDAPTSAFTPTSVLKTAKTAGVELKQIAEDKSSDKSSDSDQGSDIERCSDGSENAESIESVESNTEVIETNETHNVEDLIDGNSAKSVILPTVISVRQPVSDADIMERMWSSLPGVGAKLASSLREKYRLKHLLMIAPGDMVKWINDISNVTYPNGTRVGRPKALKILEVAKIGTDVTEIANVRDISRKILEAIPGVSSSTAQIILDHYSLRQICQGDVGTDTIAAIVRDGKRKIGQALAQKIMKYIKS